MGDSSVSTESQSELGILAPLDEMMHPYREKFEIFSELPAEGRDRAEDDRGVHDQRVKWEAVDLHDEYTVHHRGAFSA